MTEDGKVALERHASAVKGMCMLALKFKLPASAKPKAPKTLASATSAYARLGLEADDLLKRLSRVDREVLDIESDAASLPRSGRAQQLDKHVDGQASDMAGDVAEFAAMSCQIRALKLQPWELPPCVVYADDVEKNPHLSAKAAYAMLQRMLAAGLSRFDPTPVQSLARVEAATASAK